MRQSAISTVTVTEPQGVSPETITLPQNEFVFYFGYSQLSFGAIGKVVQSWDIQSSGPWQVQQGSENWFHAEGDGKKIKAHVDDNYELVERENTFYFESVAHKNKGQSRVYPVKVVQDAFIWSELAGKGSKS